MAIEFRVVDDDRREVDQMHARVHRTVDGNQDAGHFVHVNVIVQRNERRESTRPQKCDALAQHQHQNERTIEIQALTCRGEQNSIKLFLLAQQRACFDLPQARAIITNTLLSRYWNARDTNSPTLTATNSERNVRNT